MSVTPERREEGSDDGAAAWRALPRDPTGDDAAHEGPRGYDHALKDQDTFAALGRASDINRDGDGRGEQGLYSRGTRFLSRLALDVDGQPAVLLGSAARDDNTALVTKLVNAERARDGVVALERGLLLLTRSTCVRGDCLYEELVVTSYAHEPVSVELRYHLAADFRDVFEVRGIARERRGEATVPVVDGDALRFSFLGLDGVRRTTTVRFTPTPTRVDASGAALVVELLPQTPLRVVVSVACQTADRHVEVSSWQEAFAGLAEARRAREGERTRVRSDNPLLDDWLERSTADLAMLATDVKGGRLAYAGLPWFTTLFGRDAVLTSLFALWHDPELARGTLRCLAETQAKTYDERRDAQPGKIVHELREGEMAALGEVPFGRHYGSVDVTPLFAVLAGAYYDATADIDLIAELWPSIFRAAAWIDVCGDVDSDGFLEYRTSPDGLVHQGWKDSAAAIVHADGSVARGPIALCEVQAYAYSAKLNVARLAAELGDRGQAEKLTRDAANLRQRFDDAFWSDAVGGYALALDGDKRRCEVRSSNAGHCLAFPIAHPSRVAALARMLLAPDMFTGWGVRTLSSREAAFNPTSHHCGSVWPHDSAIVALGLSRWGLTEQAAELMGGLLDASAHLERHRLPELLCGFERDGEPAPTPIPSTLTARATTARSGQSARSAATAFSLLASSLGMRLEAREGRLLFQHPMLPAGVGEVEIKDLALGDARVDLVVQRQKGRVGVSVTRLEGEGEVVIIP